MIDDLIRQRRYLVNVENSVAREMARIMRDVERDATSRIVSYLGSHDPDTWLTGARQARLLNGIQAEVNAMFPRLERTVNEALREVAGAESELLAGRLAQAFAQLPEDMPIYRPSSEFLRQITTNYLPADTHAGIKPVIDRISGLDAKAQMRVKAALQRGIASGDGTPAIARAIRQAIGADSVTAREATVLARTQIQRVSNDVARQFYAKNTKLVPRVQYVAALDPKTCLACGSLDGKVFAIADAPLIPVHPQCRCALAPVVASWQEMGLSEAEANADIRRLFDGKAAERTTYESWLERQSAASQRSILGGTRYEEYRRGEPLKSFSDDTRVLTIEEYKRRAA